MMFSNQHLVNRQISRYDPDDYSFVKSFKIECYIAVLGMLFPHVLVEVSLSKEILLALLTRERPLSSVTQQVSLQDLFALERFPTLVTAKGANARVLQHVGCQANCLLEGGVTFLAAELPFITMCNHVSSLHFLRLEAFRTKRTRERSLF